MFCHLCWLLLPALPPAPTPARVTPVPETLRERLKLSPFYQKHTDVQGFPILSSKKVSERALLEAAHLIDKMIGQRPDVLQALTRNKVRFAVMAPDEMTTDIPEHNDLTPKDYWDKRARGLGATRARPAVSCGEENLLNLPGDRYNAENILVHEFAHAIHEMGLNTVDPTFDGRLRKIFDTAMKKGLWKGTYATTNRMEYWAECVQSYFDTNRSNDNQHNDINTRAKLKNYDPEVFALIEEVFKKSDWRYVRFDQRFPEEHKKIVAAYRPNKKTPTPKETPVKVTIVNATKSPVQVFWNNDGALKLYRTLAAGESYEQGTYSGHRWRALIGGREQPREFTAPEKNTTWKVE